MLTSHVRRIRLSSVNPLNLVDTPILDHRSSAVRSLWDSIRPLEDSELGFLRAAHGVIAQSIRPRYSIKERQPVSETIALRRGSCSQHLACVEAVARRQGMGTRVRALWLSRQFWNRRFPVMRLCIPHRILLAWPQFAVNEQWVGVEEIFGPVADRAAGAARFVNDRETPFEAVLSRVVDFDGRSRACSTVCDLSMFLLEDAGVFDTRDALFSQLESLEDSWRGKAFEWLYSGKRA